MKLSGRIMLLVFLVLNPVVASAGDLGLIRLNLIEGDVQVLIKDSTDWTAADVNLPLNEGDRIWVADDGRAELQIRGGVYVRLDGNTALDILTISPDSSQFYLDQGHIYLNNRQGGMQTVQIDTPQSSLRSYDNSIMLIDVSEDDTVEVSMLKGDAIAESRTGATHVTAGSTLTVRGSDSADLAPIGSPDEWEQWNIDRDRQLTAWSDSSRYLPEELHEYASDFDQNGQWNYASDYGYVWTPTVVVSTWAPYTVGSWVWMHGQNVWIAHDPWCWSPCHYGRWVFVASRGWCWVPPANGAAYWGPGYVGWIATPTYVAWVPLAPGEIYYGYGYYGPWSRNITTINANTVVVNRTYINAKAPHAVVVTRRDAFGTGRRAPVRLDENPFANAQHRTGGYGDIVPPQEKPRAPISLVPEKNDQGQRQIPNRERVRPAGTENNRQRVRPEKLPIAPPTVSRPPFPQTPPPERFRRIRPDDMKNERRLIRKRDASVFGSQPPQSLPVRKTREPRIIIRKPAQQPQKAVKGSGRTESQERQQQRR